VVTQGANDVAVCGVKEGSGRETSTQPASRRESMSGEVERNQQGGKHPHQRQHDER
jgi:hypothetical protein